MANGRTWAERIGVPESFRPALSHPEQASLPGGSDYELLVESLRLFLDDFAGATPNSETAHSLTADLQEWSRRLRSIQVPEREQAFGHRTDLPGRGQVMAPAFVLTHRHADGVEGTVTFGRYFLGGNGAVHGGAVALLFDEVLGGLSHTGGRPSGRTAYLNTVYRSVTPVEKKLRLRAWFVSEIGRKRTIRGAIFDGDTLCAEAEGLFLSLLEGQD
ncbi:MAG: thioesterase family protein [Aeromicrobium sp.]|nr:thioesterase family protein [Aeromicrobium sp.]